ncbi:MAG TPA: efflux RND transporter periplasmic adaptor subunit, partial [Lacipirellulaceae bacterium]|nr:efflux RND transporter periplasmic adaptor subunit [Lacipirellulaceae bacterium]
NTAAPLLVLTRTDPMIFVIGVPEVEAPYVAVGSKASLRIQALAGREFDVKVTRIAPALHKQSRTLTAEVDLPNANGDLLPGMYAYGSIDLNRTNVRAIPSSAVVQIGNRMCCYVVNGGKAIRTQIQTGISDGSWVEVVKKGAFPTNGIPGPWQDFDGTEKIIVGDLSEISDGGHVAVDSSQAKQAVLTGEHHGQGAVVVSTTR